MLTTAPQSLHRRVTLGVREAPDVLVRVLMTLRRRGCRILAVDYSVGDLHRDGWLAVDYVPPVRHEHAVAAWLANLVDVVQVEDTAA